jgi:hypothetical protein
MEGLAQLLSDTHLPSAEERMSPNVSLAIDLIKQYTGVYFSNFQNMEPIVHAPTWNIAECPTVLLAAMACIGAVLSSGPDAAELSSSISELCMPMITWLVSSPLLPHCPIAAH